MWSVAVLAVVPEGLAVRTVVVVSLVVGALVSVVELATADVTVGDQGVAVAAPLSEGDAKASAGGVGLPIRQVGFLGCGAVNASRPLVLRPNAENE